MADNNLADLRLEIDCCDRKIADLLSQRLHIARKIGKSGIKPAICDLDRESQVIANAQQAASPELAAYIAEIYKEIIRQSRKVQE